MDFEKELPTPQADYAPTSPRDHINLCPKHSCPGAPSSGCCPLTCAGWPLLAAELLAGVGARSRQPQPLAIPRLSVKKGRQRALNNHGLQTELCAG